MATATTFSFSQKASQNLLKLASELENKKNPSSLVQELSNNILQQNLPAQDKDIQFCLLRGVERLDLRLTKDGEITKFSRSGGNNTIQFTRPADTNATTSSRKYTWTSLQDPKSKESVPGCEKTDSFAKDAITFALAAPFIGATAIVATHLAVGAAVAATEVLVAAAVITTAALVMATAAAPLLITAAIFAAPVVIPVVAMGSVALGFGALAISPIALPLIMMCSLSSLCQGPSNHHYHHY